MRDCTSSQRVISQYPIMLIRDNKCAARTGYLIGEGATFEPFVQNRLTTIKRTRVMHLSKGLGSLHGAA